MEDAGCQAEELQGVNSSGELSGRQVQVRREGGDSAGRKVLAGSAVAVQASLRQGGDVGTG